MDLNAAGDVRGSASLRYFLKRTAVASRRLDERPDSDGKGDCGRCDEIVNGELFTVIDPTTASLAQNHAFMCKCLSDGIPTGSIKLFFALGRK